MCPTHTHTHTYIHTRTHTHYTLWGVQHLGRGDHLGRGEHLGRTLGEGEAVRLWRGCMASPPPYRPVRHATASVASRHAITTSVVTVPMISTPRRSPPHEEARYMTHWTITGAGAVECECGTRGRPLQGVSRSCSPPPSPLLCSPLLCFYLLYIYKSDDDDNT